MEGIQTNTWGIEKNDGVYILLAILLSVPAFFINLGIHPYIEDESIRALVALEMDMKGNYFFPTLGGEPYFAKPPLYNWILLLFARVFGGINEWTTRIPTVLFLYGYTAYIFYVHRRANLSAHFSIIASLLFLTCGRILFWDSFLGLIDVFFSWVMYAMIVEMYFSWKKHSLWLFYLLSYFMFSVGFLLKGFPALLFLCLTYIWIIYLDKAFLKTIFSIPHLVGLLFPVVLIGGYYLAYHQSGQINNSVNGLLEQATRRTIFRYDVMEVIKHVFVYPFENLYHFLPWSLLVFAFVSKKVIKNTVSEPFIWFCLGAFLINLLPYWVSPEVFPRYILMLIPLIFTVLYRQYCLLNVGGRLYIYYQWLFIFLGIGSIVFLGISLMSAKTVLVPYAEIKGGICMLLLLVLGYLLIRKGNKILILINMLLVLRIAFNLFVVPIRSIEDKGLMAKNDALHLVEKYGNREIHMYDESISDYTTIFHIEKNIGKLISPALDGDILIYNPFDSIEIPRGYGVVDSIYVRRVDGYMYVLEKK